MATSANLTNDIGSRAVILRSISVWAVIIAAETINGSLREIILVPRFGNILARQISFAIALVLILSIALFFVLWINAKGEFQLLIAGLVWIGLTICFELILGRIVMGLPWQRISADYDISQGGMMSFGLVFMLFAPLLASKLRAQ